jgi:hypothetical protein
MLAVTTSMLSPFGEMIPNFFSLSYIPSGIVFTSFVCSINISPNATINFMKVVQLSIRLSPVPPNSNLDSQYFL